jgi:hypothetical protein
MKTTNNISNLLMVSFRVLTIVLFFAAVTSCTTEESLVEPAAKAEAVVEETPAGIPGESASLTVSGAFIEYADGNLCSECSYVLPEDATLVDGAKLGIEPGDVICLNKAFSYGAVEVINIDGVDGKPVVIANCGE